MWKRNQKTILQINSSITLIFGICLRFCGPKAKMKKKKFHSTTTDMDWQRSFILLKQIKYFTHKEINSRRMMRSKLVFGLNLTHIRTRFVWLCVNCEPCVQMTRTFLSTTKMENDLIDKTLYVIFQRTSIQATVSCVRRCSFQFIKFNFNSVILFCMQYGNSHDSHKFKVIFRLYFFHI